MRKFGPRVYVKRDDESSIGRGCILYGAHFRPEMAIIVWAACAAARELVPAVDECWLTEGFRDIRDIDAKMDRHEVLNALDITFRMQPGDFRPTDTDYHRIKVRMRELLGPDYDVLFHAAHIHAELDPK